MRIEVEASIVDRLLWVALVLGTFGFVLGPN
jgi:hypothetical protein